MDPGVDERTVKMNFLDVRCESQLAQDGVQWLAVMNSIIDCHVP